MRIVAYSTELNSDKLTVRESPDNEITTNDPDDIFSFMLEPYDNTLKICWSLTDTVSPIFRFIGSENCKKLYKTKKLRVPPFEFFYVPDKLLSVSHSVSGLRLNLYGIDQYFPDMQEPKKVVEVQWLGEWLIGELAKMGLYCSKLTSPAAIYEECMMRNFHIPTVADIPKKEIVEYAARCAGKLWIEAYQLGFWVDAYDYDIKSAFPCTTKDLLDFRYGTWFKYDNILVDADYGYCKCIVDIDAEVSPVLHYVNNNLCTPRGRFETFLTLNEIKTIWHWDIGTVEITDGWFFKASKYIKPLEKPLKKLLSYRGKNELQDRLAKRMGVGLYGKFGEERETELGVYYNPVWFAEISSKVRCKVCDFIYNNQLFNNLIHVSVDGVLTDKLVDTDDSWRVFQRPTLVFSSGNIYQGEKKPHGLSLDDILVMIENQPNTGYYEKFVNRRVSLADACQHGDFESLGLLKPHVASLDFYRVEHDRDYVKLPLTGRQLVTKKYKSKAKVVNEQA